jgi:single-strand DNA-binding protein
MYGTNKIFILGYLGSAPKMLSSRTGSPYTALSIATHRTATKEEGSSKLTDWHFVRVWGRQAETCVKYLTKGQTVFVEGYLTQYSVDKDDGSKERKTAVQALRVEFVPKGLNEDPENVAAP